MSQVPDIAAEGEKSARAAALSIAADGMDRLEAICAGGAAGVSQIHSAGV